jgi:hypothetical protein
MNEAEWVKTKAVWQDYHMKSCAHTAHMKQSLDLDKMLEVAKVQVANKEWDLQLWEAALVEGLHPLDNLADMMEWVKLQKHMDDVKATRVAEAE